MNKTKALTVIPQPDKPKSVRTYENVGRKCKLDAALIKEITDVIAAGAYDVSACKYIGIHVATFYRWKNKGETLMNIVETNGGDFSVIDEKDMIFCEFYEAIKRAEGRGEIAAVAAVRNAFDKDWKAPMTFLERKYPDRWGRRDRNLNLNVNADLDKLDLSKLSIEELEEMEKLMLKAQT